MESIKKTGYALEGKGLQGWDPLRWHERCGQARLVLYGVKHPFSGKTGSISFKLFCHF